MTRNDFIRAYHTVVTQKMAEMTAAKPAPTKIAPAAAAPVGNPAASAAQRMPGGPVPGASGLPTPPPPSRIVTASDLAYEQGFMDKLSQEQLDPAILESLINLQTRAEERPMATVGRGAVRGLTVGSIIGAVLGALGGGLRGAAQPQDRVRNALTGAGLGTVAGGLLGGIQGVPAGILARFAAK